MTETGEPRTAEQAEQGPGEPGWHRLPDAPLSPRDHAVVVGVGERMLVVGGWEFLCPPMADCAAPQTPLLADGAVYDRATDSWRSITPPAFGLRRQEYATAVLAGSAYLLTDCADGPRCGAPTRLLSYDVADDRWTDHGRVPGPRRDRHLVAAGSRLVVHSATDEVGEVADLVFDPERSSWAELPDDPLSDTFDRFVVAHGDQLVLTGSSIPALESGAESGKQAARLDLASGRWVRLPDAPGPGYQLLATDRGPLLNGHFVDSPGWILDPDSWTWTELPRQTGERQDLSGVLDPGGATYDIPNSVGQMSTTMRLHVYDSVADSLVAIGALPAREDVYDDSSAALGRDLFVFGGQRWPSGSPTGGRLVADAWLWTAPPA
ncbi:hypothetical protein [Nocardioides sp.]|uniref:hypothetical protein n=1 Tax=Nocardioides sp. TaxID=35761 RepID=UPI0035644D9B